ncbi:poly-gamma-glutamate synthase PgsB [Leptospira ellisii]|uniref:poly-gamma-glutamate synthase PgsB n=1 Tax=Leptospira ellisii TaxID=2023197 RepID=UPI00374F9E3A
MSFIILSLSFFVFLLLLVLEKRRRSADIDAVPIRIHVNGTRGKSSVTRLIHSILAEEGWIVFSKTTGSAPSLLFPDRTEKRIFRNKISIGEQGAFLRYASSNNAQAVVLECMAVQPRYQKESEDVLVRATHTIVTNVRPDHGEWTKSEREIRKGFSETIPKEGTLILGRSVFNSDDARYFEEKARWNRTKLVSAVTWSEETKISSESIRAALDSLRYPEHRENAEIAACLCETLGVTPDSILSGIRKTIPDPGALRISETKVEGKIQRFVFAFAANDTVSWNRILQETMKTANDEGKGFDSAIVVFNSKRERPLRTVEFAKSFSERKEFSKIYFFGVWRNLFKSFYRGNAELIFCKNDFRFYTHELKLGSYLWIGAGNYQGPGRVRLNELLEDANR